MRKNTFYKNERLCGKKQIDALFAAGFSKNESPVKLIYNFINEPEAKIAVKAMFVVPKKKFKKAHHRNKLKRRMREAYRLQKAAFYKSLPEAGINIHLAFLYTASAQQPYEAVYTGINKLLNILTKESAIRLKSE